MGRIPIPNWLIVAVVVCFVVWQQERQKADLVSRLTTCQSDIQEVRRAALPSFKVQQVIFDIEGSDSAYQKALKTGDISGGELQPGWITTWDEMKSSFPGAECGGCPAPKYIKAICIDQIGRVVDSSDVMGAMAIKSRPGSG